MPTTLHALLLTDVVDSTRLTEELGDAAMAALWTAHDRVARDLLPAWHGREIDKTDGMLLLFDDVTDAVGYALAYHRALAARELPFKARAGIHVGPVSLRPNTPDDVARGAKPVEVDGLALPIAARVMSVALGAQTLLSADARLALGVAPQRVVSHGHWRMHGVTDPVELFEIGEIGEGSTAPFKAPPDSAKVYRVMRQGELWHPVREVRHSVPAERDSFVGRQEPLQLLAKKFEDGARLVSVLGMGGTGKTRLVTRFAWTVLGDYPGGVWFCDLSQARSVDGIHFAAAQGLDVPLGKTDPVVQLAHAIAGRGQCLVILDNFEQVARFAEETLGRWLDRAPLAQFLVTTREVLGIVGESTLLLDPLPARDGVALFTRRAEDAKPGFLSMPEDGLAIGQLVKVLDGLPLAIELAAARVRTMSPRVLLARMSERFTVLLSRAGRHDRQATLRAAFDWSWELLSEAERSGLAQLSVFQGGFTLAGVESVMDLSLVDNAVHASDILEWLVDKSFVRRVRDDRFDLLDSVRDYSAEHLKTEGRFAGSGTRAMLEAQTRHGAYFGSGPGARATEWPQVELDNLVAACRRAVSRGDASVAVRSLSASWSRLRLTGPFRVGLELASLVQTLDVRDDSQRCEVDLVAAAAMALAGSLVQAQSLFEAAIAASRRAANTQVEGRALSALAHLHAQRGKPADAEASFDLAISIAQANADTSLECSTRNNWGRLCESVGRFDEARSHYESALRVARAAGDRRWEGGSAGNLGQFLANLGQQAEALKLYTQAVAIAREIEDRQWEANARCNLGLLYLSQQRVAQAREELGSALDAARSMGHVSLVSIVQCNLGILAQTMDRQDDALMCFEEALGIARDLKNRRSEGQILGYLGLTHARLGRIGQARQCLDEGHEALNAVADKLSLGILLCARAEVEHFAGDDASSGAAFAQAQTLSSELQDLQPESEFGQALQRVSSLRCLA